MSRRAALLAALAVLASVPAAEAGDTIRVAVVEAARAAELHGTGIEVTPRGPCITCLSGRWRSDVVRATWTRAAVEIDGRRAPAFRLRSARPIRLNGREYSAALDLVGDGGGLAVVNELPLEEYVAGVLRAEAGERWPVEALRAQAIVARTYGAYHRQLNAGKPYHIVASNANQLYAGRVDAGSPAWGAVLDTSDRVLRWKGKLFPAFYHANSGGHTEDPRTVFGARNMPALRAVVCPFAAGAPNFSWSLDLQLTDLADRLRRGGVDVGNISAIEVPARTPSLRALVVTVRGSRGAAQLRGNDFRRLVGYDTLKSTLFAVAIDGTTARFSGRGYGHGVGLCQWGARRMAELGYSALQILEFYYPGAVLGMLDR